MLDLDEIFYEALTANTEIMTACGWDGQTLQSARIYSTCIEVAPSEADNAPLPYIIIIDEGMTNNQGTKDTTWESKEDRVTASVQVCATSPKEVKRLIRKCRKAITDYIAEMDGTPILQSLTSEGTAWDWTKPCYYKSLIYQCDINNVDDNEQE